MTSHYNSELFQPDKSPSHIPPSFQSTVLLSLTITVGETEEELSILEDQEPTEAVIAFCEEHLPDEGDACIDHLVRVVEDRLLDPRSDFVTGFV